MDKQVTIGYSIKVKGIPEKVVNPTEIDWLDPEIDKLVLFTGGDRKYYLQPSIYNHFPNDVDCNVGPFPTFLSAHMWLERVMPQFTPRFEWG